MSRYVSLLQELISTAYPVTLAFVSLVFVVLAALCLGHLLGIRAKVSSSRQLLYQLLFEVTPPNQHHRGGLGHDDSQHN